MNGRGLLRSAVAAVLIVSGVPAAVLGRPGTAAAETVTRTVLSDDFDGAAGSTPDDGRWLIESGRRGARLDGQGHLSVAGLLRSKATFAQASGRVEARIRMWRSGGAWRALGVLDAGGALPAGRVEVLGDDQVDGDDFHTYAIDWTRTTMTWTVDGRQVLRFTPETPGQAFGLALNTTSGGDRRGGAWMRLDSVRVTVPVTVTPPPAPAWKAYTTYQAGQFVKFKGVTYRVKEPHTALPGWQPDRVPGVFQKI
ncbi:carbohydrate-binding protein [Actinoplanes sp. NBRC 101535]|uniref:carbohydrate-binding protein n=1 Tax=Actinoplanes sp. NBRC 101535 TaxID=3032196 RepID=UPI0024A27E15|nr:carbohydrate-binding protein [Actinoplanes sp. NBRC 101535]GLY03479.1 hypothetical protein Acsp01_38580 [Actinoplanes sp. NBRC 101535]